MIKFFLGIAIIAFTSFCGYLLSKKYRQRKQFYTQLREFNERFLSEISYYRRPLKEFMAAYAYQGEFEEILRDFSIFLNEKASAGSSFLDGRRKYTFLKVEECQMLEDYFMMLGKGDSASQKGYFSAVKDSLVKLENESSNEAKRYGDLYVKIGFLCGLLILILMV